MLEGSRTAVSKEDIEAELQTTLPEGYSDAQVAVIISGAEAKLQLRTNRTTFTGPASILADQAMLYLTIDRLATSNRDLIKSAVSDISENGARISFKNGKDLNSYRIDAELIIADLRLDSDVSHGSYVNDSTYYA